MTDAAHRPRRPRPPSPTASSIYSVPEKVDPTESLHGGPSLSGLSLLSDLSSDGNEPTQTWRPQQKAAAAQASTDTSLLCDDQGERYRIGPRLGQGGFAEVFAAELASSESRPGTPLLQVAIKRLRPALRADPLRRRQLRREAAILATLHHPNIAAFQKLLEIDGEPALVMERCDGLPLQHWQHLLTRHGYRLRLRATAQLLQQLFLALQHLQQRAAPKPRLIHADLSLENLILTQQGVLKLIDFGVAREEQQPPSREQPALTPLSSWTPEDEQLTGLHQIGGKRTYVPPEGPPKIPAVQGDLYAAGVCAWELLSGWRFPILPAGLGAKEMGSLIAFAATGLPEPAWLLLQRCLHPNPQQRPGSAAQCLPILQRLHPDAGCGAALGKLVSALLTTPDHTALPLPQAVEPLLAPLPFIETTLRRLHDGFCAHQVLAIQPRSSEPSFAEPPTANLFWLRAQVGPDLTMESVLTQTPLPVLQTALRCGFAESPSGMLFFRLQLRTEPTLLIGLHPGPGRAYDPLALSLLRSLLTPQQQLQ